MRFDRQLIFSIKKFLATAVFSAALCACNNIGQQERLHVDITSYLGDGQQFYSGDELSFLISLNENAWLYMYYENSQGKVYQLIPSVLYPNNYVKANDFIEFPADDAHFHLEVSPPFGRERVWIFASHREITLMEVSNTDLDELSISLQKIQHRVKKTTLSSRIRYSEDILNFITTAE